jgi:23S rRNA (guanine745-N1)-methyltransferase
VQLSLSQDGRQWACAAGHGFDVAREGYVNLLLARHSRQPGDNLEMINARRRFLETGAYDPLSAALAEAVAARHPCVVLDAGCGEGRHTRAISAPVVVGVDVAKVAVAVAARAHPAGRYAVASTSDLPLADSTADVAMVVFAPVIARELARVTRPGGTVVVAHPGPEHLAGLRRLVYARPRAHQLKPPIGEEGGWFTEAGSASVRFQVTAIGPDSLRDMFAMTPYRWHAPPDIAIHLAEAASRGFQTLADVRITCYVRAHDR